MARWFYVVYVNEPVVAGCLDAIRLLAQGIAKHRAHITLMGPYDRPRPDHESLSQTIRGQSVRIYSNGTFFNETQNTVFLKATCSVFPILWDKPTISEFTPHLTIYDGGERWYATQIAQILLNARIDLTFIASGIDALGSANAKGVRPVFDAVPHELISSVIGRTFGPQLIRNSSHSVRIVCIQRLLEFLANQSQSARDDKRIAVSQ